MPTRAWRVWLPAGVLAAAACRSPAAVRPDDTASEQARPALDGAASRAGDEAARDASADASDAESRDARAEDACVPGETWEAKVQVRKTWHDVAKMVLQGPLELTVPRMGAMGARRTIYRDCAMTGGGCGDCSKPGSPDQISCELTATRVHVDIGVDDVGPTYVEVVQRGNAIVADWTHGGMIGAPGQIGQETRSTEVLLVLPCAVHVHFTR